MSDYGNDDFDLDWLYVEDEYVMADELAEHVVPSPPPSNYADSDYEPEWDRFDYYIDLEYASDGYDDANFYPHKAKGEKIGQKRKRGMAGQRSKKKQKLGDGHAVAIKDLPELSYPPVMWRSQKDRDPKPKLLDANAESYALLKDWRERIPHASVWTAPSPQPELGAPTSKTAKPTPMDTLTPKSPAAELDDIEDDESSAEIDPEALMAVLQDRLAAAGGPLKGMDPKQLLEFAMRMATGHDAGDDVAGEMADAIFDQEDGDDEEGDEEAEANLLSWISQQQNAHQAASANGDPTVPKPSEGSRRTKPSQTLSSESNDNIRAMEDAGDSLNSAAFQHNDALEVDLEMYARKRRAVEDVANSESSTNTSKKRATRSYEAPVAASYAPSVPAKATDDGRAKR